jgi:hypothetical protein
VTRGRWRLAAALLLVAVVAAVAIVLASGGGRARPPRVVVPRGIAYGANVNWMFNDPAYTSEQIAGQLASLHATGATVARTDSLWERSEPSPPSDGVHHYDWAFDDEITSSLAQHGLRWLPIVDYSPPWASVDAALLHSPPASPANYAAYAGALAARYGVDGTFWRLHPALPQLPVQQFEIWNEPDNPEFWAPSPNAGDYASLYLAARAAIHTADPTAAVIVGGLTNPPGFIPALVAADPSLPAQVDGVAIHPYAYAPAAVLGRVARARAALDAYGMTRVPLYVTEFGWTTSPAGALDYVAAGQRPGYIESAIEQLAVSGCGLDSVVLYTWTTPDAGPTDPQQWFGVDPPGAGGSADVTAFASGLRAAHADTGATGACTG